MNLGVFFYAITAFASGYKSGSMYAQSRGQHWKMVMMLTSLVFPMFLVSVSFGLNVVSKYQITWQMS